MRLSLVTDTYLPEVNGVTTVVATMHRGLLARGHQVQVVAPAYPHSAPDEALIHRIPSVPCPAYPAVRLSWPWGRGLGGTISNFAPELIHVITEGPLGWFGRAHAQRSGRPLVTSFHTDFPRYAGEYLGAWAIGPTRRYLRWFHGPAVATQTPSDATRDELRALGLAGAVTWGRAVDCATFSPTRRSDARRARVGAVARPLVLHVGRLAVEKDMQTLIAAFQEVHAALGAGVAFCVAGDGPEGTRVRRELPFARHLGFLDRETLADLYADADLLVFPSPTETCGLVALEAMASGLPVIGANAGGVPDNVRDGLTGRIVPAGDPAAFARATLELLDDGGSRYAMGQAARAFAVGRDWRRELDVLVEEYQRALRRSPERREAAREGGLETCGTGRNSVRSEGLEPPTF